MKKTLLAITLILVAAIAAAIYYLFTNLDAIVEAAIEKYGSEAVKTSVQVDRVAIRLTEGLATVSGLSIANPEGFSLPQAFSLGEIAVGIDLARTDKQLIAIDLISIESPKVFYEINADRKGSLNVLKDNLGLGGGPDASASSGSTAESGQAPLKLSIGRFVFKDASLQARIVPIQGKTYDLKLPTLTLNNLQGTPDQIARQLLDRLIEHAKSEIRKQGLDRELAEIKAKAQQRIDEEKARLQQQADERIDQEKQEAEDKLKDLLRR